MGRLAMRALRRNLPPGILPDRRAAHSALRRMFARGRRQRMAMTLVRFCWPTASAREPLRIFLAQIAADLRITDLGWWEEARGALFILLEGSGECASPLGRWTARARTLGVAIQTAPATFPMAGVTLGALLESLA